MSVAIEVLSRLALRATPDKAEAFLDIGLQCYRSHEVAQEHSLHQPVGDLLQRSWEALPIERRTATAVDLLSTPIVGMDNFSASIPSRFPDPGDFLEVEDLPVELALEDTARWRDVISLLLRGLDFDEESRKRASKRILLVLERGLLTGVESSALEKALWSDKYTTPAGLPMETCLLDWAFLIHPQPNTDMAEQRFRLKWLSGDASQVQDSMQRDGNTISVSLGPRPQDPGKIEDILWNVGAALSGLRNHGIPLQLTDGERKYIADVAELWAEADNLPRSLSFFPAAAAEPTRWAIRGLASILAEGAIPKSVGGRIYEKVKRLDESRTPGF